MSRKERKSLSPSQQDQMREALETIPMDDKCELNYRAEQAVKKGEYKGNTSEYKYDQLFLNRDSEFFRAI